jgi:anti-anti-sigma regulatory factor
MIASLLIEAPQVVEHDVDIERARYVLAEGLDVVVDVRSTEVLTAEGSRAIERLHQFAIERGRELVLYGPHGCVMEVLVLTGIAQVVEVLDARTGVATALSPRARRPCSGAASGGAA